MILGKSRKVFIQKQLEKYNIVSTTDSNGTIVDVNDLFCAVAQYKREELIGKNHRILKSDKHSNALFKEMWRTISSGNTWRGEVCNQAKDRSLYWADTFIIPELDRNGIPVFYHAFKVLITKRKTIEQELIKAKEKLEEQVAKLKASELKYQNLYNTTPEMYFSVNVSGKILDVNAFGATALGYKPTELINASVLILFEPHLHNAVNNQLKQCIDNPSDVHQWEIQKIKKDGTKIIVSETVWIEKEPNNTVILRIICKDITKRKEAENALAAERSLLLNGPTVIFQWAASKGLPYIYISSNAHTILGYTAEDFLTKKTIYNNNIHSKDRKRVIDEVKALKSTSVLKYEQEYRIIHKNGATRWIRAHVLITRDKNGAIQLYNAHLYDITERHLARVESEIAKEHLNILIEAIPDAIFFKDGDGRWLITNEVAKKMFKLHELDWFGKTDIELGELRPAYMEAHQECIASDEQAWQAKKLTFSTEYVTNESGEKRELSVRKMPLFNEDGSRKALVIIGSDITESKLKETEIIIKNAKLEQVAWMFSHQVRAPVATIMGLANIFNFKDNTDPINTDVLARIRQPIDSLHTTISYIVKETNELDE